MPSYQTSAKIHTIISTQSKQFFSGSPYSVAPAKRIDWFQ